MSQTKKTLSVLIMDKNYHISCEASEEPLLHASASHLNESMHAIRQSGKVVGADRVAVMAALNATNDLLHGQSPSGSKQAAQLIPTEQVQSTHLQAMINKIDQALAQFPAEADSPDPERAQHKTDNAQI